MSRFSERQTPLPPPGEPSPISPPKIQRGRFYGGDDFKPSSDRQTPRPGSRSPSDSDWKRPRPEESSRRPASTEPPPPPPWQQQPPPPPWFQKDAVAPVAAPQPQASKGGGRAPVTAEVAKTLDEARKAYNGGIKLAKLALAFHEALGKYFPQSGGPIPRINGVSYEEAFRNENKMLKEALPQFKKTLEKLGPISSAFAEDLRTRSDNNVRAIEGYMKEWKDLKIKLEFQGASKTEMTRLWSDYARARRIESLKQEIEKPSEYA
jgi:hypothetical protein